MIKKFLTVLIAFAVMAEALCGFSVFAAGQSLPQKNVQLTLDSEDVGDIVYGKEALWKLSIKNPNSKALSVVMTAKVFDSEENVVWQEEKSVTLKASTLQLIGFKCEVQKYGIYKMKVSLSGDLETVERTQSFACVEKSNSLNDFVGVQTHFVWETRDCTQKNLPLISKSGFGVIRDHIEWYQVDVTKENGIPEKVVDFVDEIEKSGQKLILSIGNSNSKYDNGGLPVSDDALKAFGEYCAYVAKRFKGKVYAYEIWNEPDYFSEFTNNIQNTGQQYAKVLETAYNAICGENGVDKDALIFGGSLTAICKTANGSDNSALLYMKDMFSAGAANYMHAFSFHPYANTGEYFDENAQSRLNLETQIGLVKEVLREYNAGNLGIWITEIGTSSYVSSDGTSYTEEEQAVNIQRAILIAREDPDIWGVSLYNHREKGFASESREQNFGLINSDYTAKPAYVGISFLNRLLKNILSAKKSTNSGLTSYCLEKSNGDAVFAFWSKKGETNTIAVKKSEVSDTEFAEGTFLYPNTKNVSVYDMYGNLLSGESFSVSEEPIYIAVECQTLPLEVSVESGKVKISGKTTDESGFVTIVLYKNILTTKELVYVDQLLCKDNGMYDAEFDLPGSDLYGISIYNGVVQQSTLNSSGYGFNLEIHKNGEKIDSLKEAKSGDEIKVKLCAEDKSNIGDELIFYGAVKKNDGALIFAKKDKVKWSEDRSGTAELEFIISDENDTNNIEFMIWNSILKPIISTVKAK